MKGLILAYFFFFFFFKEMATDPRILAWKSPCRLTYYSSWDPKRVGHDLVTEQQQFGIGMDCVVPCSYSS